MNTNLEHYRIFYYAGKYGSITQAAEELSISQPAVSQALKQLEHTLGTALFIRTVKGVRFTAEGEMLYSYVARGYEYIQNGEEKLMQMLNLSTGEIRIGASDMSLQYYLLPYLEQFHEKYPKIKITVSNATTPETLVNLQDRLRPGDSAFPYEKGSAHSGGAEAPGYLCGGQPFRPSAEEEAFL